MPPLFFYNLYVAVHIYLRQNYDCSVIDTARYQATIGSNRYQESGIEIFSITHWICYYWLSAQREFEGVPPEDLRRRTETQTKFGAQFWRTILAQNYLKQNLAHDFGAASNNLITVLQENIINNKYKYGSNFSSSWTCFGAG